MTYYLGIDGGGTGCRAALADAGGRILARGTGGPANINSDPDTAVHNLLQATHEALAEVEGRMTDIVAAVLGVAGGGIAGAVTRVTPMLPFARLRIVNDAVTAATGALGTDDGILVAVGTGSVIAVQQGKRLAQYGGRGFLMGDEGSGAVLGRALLARAMRAEDGFVPLTPLMSAILTEFGGTEGIIAFAGRARPVDYAALAPRIAGSDDAAAQAVFQAEGGMLAAMIDHLQTASPLPVVFIGGLGPSYAHHFAARWPMAAAKGCGVDGALMLARQMDAAR